MADPTPAAGGDLGELLRQMQEVKRKLSDLESPSGTQRYRSVEKLSALIDDIQQQLDDYIQNQAYTKAQVDARVANPPSGVAATGNVSATGNMSAGGSVSAGSDLVGRNLYATEAPTYIISGSRVTAWLETATGRLGYAPSSRRYKQDEEPAPVDVAAMLQVEPTRFRYRDQVELHGDAAPVEVGFIAEELEALGLHPWVTYREIEGELVPDGVNYPMIVVAQQAVLRHLNARQQAQQDQIDALTARLDALGGTP